jgi:predicted nuclease of predicted toxin-antitoxin system
MTIWIDAQLSPAIARWISSEFPVEAIPIRDVGLRDASDREIFLAAKKASVVVMTKDSDFLRLQAELGSPPQVIWLSCGNTSNANLARILKNALPKTFELLNAEEVMIEISG